MGLQAKKSLGQHFLNSESVLGKIISAANIKGGETILEIGPGTGILTDALLKAEAQVIAVEKDDRAYELLKGRFSAEIAAGRLLLHHGDILKTDRTIFGSGNGEYAVVANIPYYITGAILESFLEYEPRPSRMVLLVQKEVAERIVARDGKESLLSISVKAFGIPKMVAKVPRGAFTPAPKVDSAILSIEDISDRRFKENGADIKKFFEIVKAGFAHKRKLLKRNLEETTEKNALERVWKSLSLDENVRAEDLRPEDWFLLSKAG